MNHGGFFLSPGTSSGDQAAAEQSREHRRMGGLVQGNVGGDRKFGRQEKRRRSLNGTKWRWEKSEAVYKI